MRDKCSHLFGAIPSCYRIFATQRVQERYLKRQMNQTKQHLVNTKEKSHINIEKLICILNLDIKSNNKCK